VCDDKACRGVAFYIGQQSREKVVETRVITDEHKQIVRIVAYSLPQGSLVNKSSDNKSRIIKNALNRNILRSLLNIFQIIHTRRKTRPHRPELQLRIFLLELLHGILQVLIVQRHEHDIQSLTGRFERQRLPDARSRSGDQRPRGIVSFLQVGDGTDGGHVDLG